MRPVVSSSAPRSIQPHAPRRPADRGRSPRARPGMTVHRVRNSVDDGYRSPLLPGLKSSSEADRLADELAFAATRLRVLESAPPGLYAEVADPAGDVEERTWLAFLIAYLAPLESDDPFASIRAARRPWASGERPALEDVETGPRGAHDPAHPYRTIEAYRAWASRAGSQSAAFAWRARVDAGAALRPGVRAAGPPGPAPRRALRAAREPRAASAYTTSGRARWPSAAAAAIRLRSPPSARWGSATRCCSSGGRRSWRRAAGTPLAALDLGFYNWERGERATVGLGAGGRA